MDRGTDLQEETETIARNQGIGVAIFVYRLALHILHHEVWKAGRSRSAVQKPRDVGVLQARKNLSFLPKTTDCWTGFQVVANQLDRDALVEFAVRSCGQ